MPHDTDLPLSRRGALLAAFIVSGLPLSAWSTPMNPAGPRPPGAEGFDFLLGSWTVRHRKLSARLRGSADWVEFPGTLDVRAILGGLGDIDENVLEDPAGRVLATSLRVFDAKSGDWSIYWIDARAPGLDPPLVGRFEGRVGHFYNDDVFEGRPVRVRFIYEDLGPRQARWSQAFSPDHGATWETNWTMDFTRTGA